MDGATITGDHLVYTGTLCMYIAEMSLLIITKVIIAFFHWTQNELIVAQPRALACIACTTQSVGLHCLHNPERWPALPTQPRALACIAWHNPER